MRYRINKIQKNKAEMYCLYSMVSLTPTVNKYKMTGLLTLLLCHLTTINLRYSYYK